MAGHCGGFRARDYAPRHRSTVIRSRIGAQPSVVEHRDDEHLVRRPHGDARISDETRRFQRDRRELQARPRWRRRRRRRRSANPTRSEPTGAVPAPFSRAPTINNMSAPPGVARLFSLAALDNADACLTTVSAPRPEGGTTQRRGPSSTKLSRTVPPTRRVLCARTLCSGRGC